MRDESFLTRVCRLNSLEDREIATRSRRHEGVARRQREIPSEQKLCIVKDEEKLLLLEQQKCAAA